MREPQADRSIDVLVVDDMADQARTVCQRLEDAGLQVTALLVSMSQKDLESGSIPRKHIVRVLKEINRLEPRVVLVDVCLYDQPFAQKSPRAVKSGTWTGPALMAAIRRESPETRIASYSAFPTDLTDIREERRKHGVDDTVHCSVRDLTSEVIRFCLR